MTQIINIKTLTLIFYLKSELERTANNISIGGHGAKNRLQIIEEAREEAKLFLRVFGINENL
jgi:hypothetical protein